MQNIQSSSEQTSFLTRNKVNLFGLLMGVVFGFVMSRSGATTFDYHAQMFLFMDLQLMQVIGTAMVVSVIGVVLLKKFRVRAIGTKQPVNFIKKPYKKGLVFGALLFGVGWGMSAACPGTVPAMMGEGKVAAMVTFVGILLGTLGYGLFAHFVEKRHSHKNG